MSWWLKQMVFSESFSRSDEIEAAKRRRFSSLEVAHRQRKNLMHDPQQGLSDHFDQVPLVMGASERVQAMAEPVAFNCFSDASLGSDDSSLQNGQPSGGGDDLIVSAQARAQQIIVEARDTARTMLRQAREVIESDRIAAVESGREQGRIEGRAEADLEASGLLHACEQIGIHVAQERQDVLEANEQDVVELAIAIAQRIVAASLDVDRDLVIDACRSAMRKAFQRGDMQVLAHPDDLDILRSAGPKLAAEMGGVEHLEFIAERRLDRGSVIVRTAAGEIDGTIASKSEKIEQTLREGIQQRRAERRMRD